MHGEVRSEACGSIAIRGRPEPLKAYTIHALGRWRASLGRRTGRALSRFVGRERELTALRDILAQVQAGRAQVVGSSASPASASPGCSMSSIAG